MVRSLDGVTPAIADSAYVDPSAQVIGNVTLAPNSSIWAGVVIRGDVSAIRVGAYSNIQDGSILHGSTGIELVVGEWVTVGHGAILHGCTIEDRCLIGIGSIVLTGARIGHDAIIAAGALIPEHTVVEPGTLWMGSPAKRRRATTEEDKARIMQFGRNYQRMREQYLKEKFAPAAKLDV